MQRVGHRAIAKGVTSLLCEGSLTVQVRSFFSTATLQWDGFGVDHQQKGHICDVLAGVKEDGEGTARGKQMEKPPGNPTVEQELVTVSVSLCSNSVFKQSCWNVRA